MLRIERVFFQGAGTFQARLVARNSIRNRAGAQSCKQRAGLYESHYTPTLRKSKVFKAGVNTILFVHTTRIFADSTSKFEVPVS